MDTGQADTGQADDQAPAADAAVSKAPSTGCRQVSTTGSQPAGAVAGAPAAEGVPGAGGAEAACGGAHGRHLPATSGRSATGAGAPPAAAAAGAPAHQAPGSECPAAAASEVGNQAASTGSQPAAGPHSAQQLPATEGQATTRANPAAAGVPQPPSRQVGRRVRTPAADGQAAIDQATALALLREWCGGQPTAGQRLTDVRHDGRTALQWAVVHQNALVVRHILQHVRTQLPPEAAEAYLLAESQRYRDDRGTALHLAVVYGSRQAAASVLRHVPAEHLTSVLLGQNAFRRTPLHLACEKGDLAMVRELLGEHQGFATPLQHFVTLAVSDSHPGAETPLHTAARCGQLAVVRHLLGLAVGADEARGLLFARGSSQEYSRLYTRLTALHVAAYYGHGEVAEVLLEHLERHAAASVPEYVQEVARAVPLRLLQVDEDDAPPLARRAATVKLSALHMAVEQGRAEAVATLLRYARQYDSRPDRQVAVSGSGGVGDEPLVLQEAAVTQVTGGSRCNVVHLVCQVDCQDDALDTLATLLASYRWGANLHDALNTPCEEGWTPAQWIASKPRLWDLLSLLVDHVMERTQGGRRDFGVGIGISVGHHLSAVHEWLLGYMADFESESHQSCYGLVLDGWLLHRAAKRGHAHTVRWLLDPPGVPAVAAAGKAAGGAGGYKRGLVWRRWVVKEDGRGLTAWHHAARSGSRETLQLLVEYDRYLMFEPSKAGMPSLVGTPEADLRPDSPAAGWWRTLAIDKFPPGRQIIADSCGGLLVGAAVIAGVAFTAVYNPPRGFGDDTAAFQARPAPLVAFYWLNSLSLYCALASIVLGAGMSLPQPDHSPRQELRRMVQWVFYTTLFLLLALLFNAGAFATAMVACLPPGAPQLRAQVVAMVCLGAALVSVCIGFVALPLRRLLLAQDMLGKDLSSWEVLLGSRVYPVLQPVLAAAGQAAAGVRRGWGAGVQWLGSWFASCGRYAQAMQAAFEASRALARARRAQQAALAALQQQLQQQQEQQGAGLPSLASAVLLHIGSGQLSNPVGSLGTPVQSPFEAAARRLPSGDTEVLDIT